MSDFLDSNGLRYLWTKIKNVFVAKETGKGLSSNDFTSTYKSKLDGIATGANKYILPTASASTLGGIKVGSGLSISNGVLSATGGGGLKVIATGNMSVYGNDGYYGSTTTKSLSAPALFLIINDYDFETPRAYFCGVGGYTMISYKEGEHSYANGDVSLSSDGNTISLHADERDHCRIKYIAIG